jgi:hypothetical protein
MLSPSIPTTGISDATTRCGLPNIRALLGEAYDDGVQPERRSKALA